MLLNVKVCIYSKRCMNENQHNRLHHSYFPCIFKNTHVDLAWMCGTLPCTHASVRLYLTVLVVRMCAQIQGPNLVSHKTNIHWAPFGNDPVVKIGLPYCHLTLGELSHISATAHLVHGDHIWHHVGRVGAGSVVCEKWLMMHSCAWDTTCTPLKQTK